MSDTPLTPLTDFVLSFVQAHKEIVELLDAVVAARVRPAAPAGWDRYGEHLDTLHRRRHDVTAFLVRYGRENPEAARQAVANMIGACAWARQEIQQTAWASLDLPRIRDAVAATAEPVLQAMRLFCEPAEGPGGLTGGPADTNGGGPPAAAGVSHPDPGRIAAGPADEAPDAAPPWLRMVEGLGVTLNLREWKVTRGTADASFAGKEYPWKIFRRLCDSYPHSLSGDDLVDAVWGRGEGSKDALQVHMNAVRKLLKPLGLAVECVRKVGYKLLESPAG